MFKLEILPTKQQSWRGGGGGGWVPKVQFLHPILHYVLDRKLSPSSMVVNDDKLRKILTHKRNDLSLCELVSFFLCFFPIFPVNENRRLSFSERVIYILIWTFVKRKRIWKNTQAQTQREKKILIQNKK